MTNIQKRVPKVHDWAGPQHMRPSAVSQVLRVIRDEADGLPANLIDVQAGGPARVTEQGFMFTASDQYRVRVASSIEHRCKAWGLAYKVYREKGYAEENSQNLWYSLHDALRRTVTFLAERDGEARAALTVVFDSPLGLPIDGVFGAEMDALRRQGRRPCELVSLVCVEDRQAMGAELVKRLFKLAYLTARRLEAASDFAITVNPRHVPFYERTLLFERIAEDRPYEKVCGAPATALKLDLLTAEERYRAKYGALKDERNLYRFFIDEQEPMVLSWLRACRRPLDEASLRRYFMHERDLLATARPEHRHHLQDEYLAIELVAV